MSGVRRSKKAVRTRRRINNSKRNTIRVAISQKSQHKTNERVLIFPTRKGGTYPGETGLAEIDE